MQANIQTILAELYALEPDLRKKEDAIIRIIEKMQANRPSIEIDEEFRVELRKKVLIELQKTGLLRSSQGPKSSWNWGWIFGGLSTALLASFLIFAYFGGIAFWSLPDGVKDGGIITTTSSPLRTLSFAPTITSVGSDGFGKNVSLVSSVGQLGTPQAISAVAPMARGMGGGGVSTENAKMMATDAMIMPVMDYPYYTYTYTGAIPTPSGDLVVYRKNPSGFTSRETSSFLSSFAIDGINLGAFGNKNLSNFSFVEDQDFGYSVTLDFQNGNIGIYQNWAKWPQVKCDANGCEQPPKITEKDIPSDDEFIRIADSFLTQYGIDRSLYGTPKVDGSWRIMYARAMKENQETYIPDQYTVSYPLTLAGKSIYEEYGGYKGITLTVDVRTKRVVGLYGLEKQNLASSVYTTLTSEDTLRKMIQFGGRYETKPYGEQKTIEITLGEPTIQYVHVYGEYRDGKSDEYYVPAYAFPILNKPEGSYLQDSIIIPAIADFAIFVPISDAPVAIPMPELMEKVAQ